MNNSISYTIVLLFFLTIFGSCRNSTGLELYEEKPNINLVVEKASKILNSSVSLDEKKSVYTSMNAEEKLGFWIKRVHEFSVRSNLDINQKKSLEIFKSIISKEVFSQGNTRDIFFLETFPTYIDKLTSLFSANQLYDLFFNINSNNAMMNIETNIRSTSNTENQDGKCICNVQSRFTCPYPNIITGLISFGSCYYGHTGVTCITTTKGCGALFDDTCNGAICLYY